MSEERLYRLSELDDYKVADQDPDIRGWRLQENNGNPVGIVEELIVDKDEQVVRYLDVKVDDDRHNYSEELHLLIPVGVAQLHGQDDHIELKGVDVSTVLKCPSYNKKSPITRDYEEQVVQTYDPTYGKSARNPSEFYTYDRFFDVYSFYGPRRTGNHTNVSSFPTGEGRFREDRG